MGLYYIKLLHNESYQQTEPTAYRMGEKSSQFYWDKGQYLDYVKNCKM